MRRAVLAITPLLLLGCASTGPEKAPEPGGDLAAQEGHRVRLRTDLPPDEARALLARLDGLEDALDTTFPFLAPPAAPPLTIVIAEPARFTLIAREHRVDGPADAFLGASGVVVARYAPEEQAGALEDGLGGPSPVALEPVVRPLAAATFRRRLLVGLGADLPTTWLEDGLCAAYLDVVAPPTGGPRPARRALERVLDAHLPLYLGAEPALTRILGARGDSEKRRAGSGPLAWAVARFLLDDPARTPLLEAALRRAAGALDDARWEATRAALDGMDREFEGWLQAATHEALLRAIVEAPTPVDRWEAAAALRLLANVDLDPDQPDEVRARQARATRDLLRSQPAPARFLDKFAGDLALVHDARNRLQAMSRVRSLASRELERRSKGYGHPAVEAARADLGRALQRALDAGG